MKEMAQAYRQSVGGMLVFGFDPQKLLYHQLHLGLGGLAVAHYRLLHH